MYAEDREGVNVKTQIEKSQSDKSESDFLDVITGMRVEKVYEAINKFMLKLQKEDPDLYAEAIRMLKE